MSKFPTDLNARRMEDNKWALMAILVCECSDKTIFIACAGLETDFASVPRLPLAYLIAGNTAHKAAVIHDYLYRSTHHPVTRKRA